MNGDVGPDRGRPLAPELRSLRVGEGASSPGMRKCPRLMLALGQDLPGLAVTALEGQIRQLGAADQELLLVAFGFLRRAVGRGLEQRRGKRSLDPDIEAVAQSTWFRRENDAIDRLVDLMEEKALVAQEPPPLVDSMEAVRSPTTSEAVGVIFTVLYSETLFTFTDDGRLLLHMSRTVQAEQDAVTSFVDYYSGASRAGGGSCRFVADYGCEVESSQSTEISPAVIMATFRMSRSLAKGEIHTVRYRVDVDRDSAPDHDTLNPWVRSVYGDTEPTRRERMLVQFAPARIPKEVWRMISPTDTRLPGAPTVQNRLPVDNLGCTEWEFSDLLPGRHYAICWRWPRQD